MPALSVRRPGARRPSIAAQAVETCWWDGCRTGGGRHMGRYREVAMATVISVTCLVPCRREGRQRMARRRRAGAGRTALAYEQIVYLDCIQFLGIGKEDRPARRKYDSGPGSGSPEGSGDCLSAADQLLAVGRVARALHGDARQRR